MVRGNGRRAAHGIAIVHQYIIGSVPLGETSREQRHSSSGRVACGLRGVLECNAHNAQRFQHYLALLLQ